MLLQSFFFRDDILPGAPISDGRSAVLLTLFHVNAGIRVVAFFAFRLRGVKVDLLPPRLDPCSLFDPILVEVLFEFWQVISGLFLGDRLDALVYFLIDQFNIRPEHV